MNDLKSLLSPQIYEKLQKLESTSLLDILVTQDFELSIKTDITVDEIKKIKLKLSNSIHSLDKIIKVSKLDCLKRLKTGCHNIDSILNNGIPFGRITEIFGQSGVGKTQFCLQLTLECIQQYKKGSVYICTEDVFPSKRFQQLGYYYAVNNNVDNSVFGKSTFLYHAFDFEQFQNCIDVHLPALLNRQSIGLIVIDSIAGPFRNNENNSDYKNRAKNLILLSNKLNEVCQKFDVTVVCTNQVTEDIEVNKIKPCLGSIWTNSLNLRCEISRKNDSWHSRQFKVIFSPDFQFINDKCSFSITEEGLKC